MTTRDFPSTPFEKVLKLFGIGDTPSETRTHIDERAKTSRPPSTTRFRLEPAAVAHSNGASKDMVLVPREEYEALLAERELRQADEDEIVIFPPKRSYYTTVNIRHTGRGDFVVMPEDIDEDES